MFELTAGTQLGEAGGINCKMLNLCFASCMGLDLWYRLSTRKEVLQATFSPKTVKRN